MKYLTLLLLPLLTSCALGSGASLVSGASWHAKTADGLTPEAEERIVQRVIRESNFVNRVD